MIDGGYANKIEEHHIETEAADSDISCGNRDDRNCGGDCGPIR